MQFPEEEIRSISPRLTKSREHFAQSLLEQNDCVSPQHRPNVALNESIKKTPQKQRLINRMKNIFNQSSTNKPNYLSWKDDENPYEKFQDKGIISSAKLLADFSSNRSNKDEVLPRFDYQRQSPDEQSNSDSSSSSSRQKNKGRYQRKFNKQYKKLLKRFRTEEQVQFPLPFFLQTNSKNNLTKLLCFTPNAKNGKNIAYDFNANTCRPIFKCQGCYREFTVASALGGHLSKCIKQRYNTAVKEESISEEIISEDDDSEKEEGNESLVDSEEQEQKYQISEKESQLLKRSKKIKKRSQIRMRKTGVKVKRNEKSQIQPSIRTSPRKLTKPAVQHSLARNTRSKRIQNKILLE